MTAINFTRSEDDGSYRPELYGDDGRYRPGGADGRYAGIRNNAISNFNSVGLFSKTGRLQPVVKTYEPIYQTTYRPYQKIYTPLVELNRYV